MGSYVRSSAFGARLFPHFWLPFLHLRRSGCFSRSSKSGEVILGGMELTSRVVFLLCRCRATLERVSGYHARTGGNLRDSQAGDDRSYRCMVGGFREIGHDWSLGVLYLIIANRCHLPRLTTFPSRNATVIEFIHVTLSPVSSPNLSRVLAFLQVDPPRRQARAPAVCVVCGGNSLI